MKPLRCIALICVVLSFLLIPPPSSAQQTISNGTVTVGIGPNGELFDNTSYIGIKRLSDGYDPLAPGSPRDSWGLSANGSSVWADQAYYGANGVISISNIGPSSAVVTTTGANGMNVTQAYSFAAANILKISETLTNTSTGPEAVLFQRDVDWDVSPTEFNENSFAGQVSGNVIDSSYYGFESPNPTTAYGSSCAAGCNQTGDLGGGIKLDLGTLLANESETVTFLYGINQVGETANELDAQLKSLGAYYYVTTQSSENGAYPSLGANSAAIAVSATPEPSSLLLLATGLLGMFVAFGRKLMA